jgi:hypothetical protein
LLVTANVVPSSPILVNLTMEALVFSETPVLKRATRCNVPEDGILYYQVVRSHSVGQYWIFVSSKEVHHSQDEFPSFVFVLTQINPAISLFLRS